MNRIWIYYSMVEQSMQIYPTIVGLSGVRNPKINPTAGIVFITTATWT